MTNRKALQKILMLNFLFILMAILAVNAGAKVFTIQNESVNMLVVNGMIFLLIIVSLYLTKNRKEKKRAQQSQANLLNLSSSLHPEAIGSKFRYVYKSFALLLTLLFNLTKVGWQSLAYCAGLKIQFASSRGDAGSNLVRESRSHRQIFLLFVLFFLLITPYVQAKVFTIQNEEEIINDFKIVACATIHNVDVLVSNDNKTMLSTVSKRAYTSVNGIRRLITPDFIDFEGFKKILRGVNFD